MLRNLHFFFLPQIVCILTRPYLPLPLDRDAFPQNAMCPINKAQRAL